MPYVNMKITRGGATAAKGVHKPLAAARLALRDAILRIAPQGEAHF